MTEKRVLVICIDRDNDIGDKVGLVGPIIGRKSNIDIAGRLGIKDPGDSDVNAIFKAIQVYDGLRGYNKEIVTLTGNKNVGLESDKIILHQLERVLKRFYVEEAILITDGSEDEQVIPLLKTKIRLIYPKRVIVKQNAELEGTYYLAHEFLKRVFSNPKVERMVFGLPAVALIIYAMFGSAGWRLILFLTGLYLFIKGFGLETYIEKGWKEVESALYVRKLTFFSYFVALGFTILGATRGYDAIVMSGATGVVMPAAIFVNRFILWGFISAVVLGMGRLLMHEKKRMAKYTTVFVLLFSFAWITFEITNYIIESSTGYANIFRAVVVGGGLIVISLVMERVARKKKKTSR